MSTQFEKTELILKTFRMFGDPLSPFWFLGLEESTTKPVSAEQQIEKQYNAALDYIYTGKIALFSESSSSDFLGNTANHKKPKHQPTWAGYIKLLLSIYDADTANETPWRLSDVKEYQKTRLGRLGKDEYGSCLMELFPFPRKTRSHPWIYKEFADQPDLSFLKSCSAFKKHPLTLQRSPILLQQVSKHKPRAMFCFGQDCKKHLQRRLDVEPEKTYVPSNDNDKSLPVSFIQYDSTLLVFSHHPTARGVSDKYWRELGEIVARKLEGNSELKRAA